MPIHVESDELGNEEGAGMIGIVIIVAAVVMMVKVADIENRSPVVWGSLTVASCIGAVALIPVPLVNLLVGVVAPLVGMFVLKALGR